MSLAGSLLLFIGETWITLRIDGVTLVPVWLAGETWLTVGPAVEIRVSVESGVSVRLAGETWLTVRPAIET